jgi:hypothetical protein
LSSSTVELNGKRYDAVTGVFLGNSSVRPRPDKLGDTLKGHHQGRSIDGFGSRLPALTTTLKRQPVAHSSGFHSRAAVTPVRHPSPVQSMDGFAQVTNTVVPHQPARSLTLMRGAVKSPEIVRKPVVEGTVPVGKQAAELHHVTPKLSAARVNPSRLEHAKQVVRSHSVKHFQTNQQQASRATPAPQPVSVPPHRSAPPIQRIEQTEEDMFESAIAQATSHEQKAPKRHMSLKRKLGNSAAALVAMVVIGIFIAYLNLPTIEINVASAQAGFHATVPNYKELGFTMDGPVRASGGTVAMSFSSGDSQFTLTQEASNWDNQTLMETLASQSDSLPKSILSSGRTIYMIRTNQATWVNGGIRYQLTGNANLNSQEITSVADSM